jgi:hypothetical protein
MAAFPSFSASGLKSSISNPRRISNSSARLALLVNPRNALLSQETLERPETATRSFGMEVFVLRASNDNEIESAIVDGRAAKAASILMSYGADLPNSYRQAVSMSAASSKGQKPGDLLVMQPNRVRVSRQSEGRKAIGLTIPESSPCVPTM